MKKKIRDLTFEEKNSICMEHDCEDCPLNFKDNKEYGKGYFACWNDIQEGHIKYASKRTSSRFIKKEIQKINKEQEPDKEIEVEEC